MGTLKGDSQVLLVGLTGGLASGKSTVGGLLKKAGIPVLDADSVGHELIADPQGRVHQAIVEEFGDLILDAGHTIDRVALGALVFARAASLRRLEEILHPAIGEEIARRIAALAGKHRLVVIEVPLMFESGWHKLVDLVVVVDCPEDAQVARFATRTGLGPTEARHRMARQLGRKERIERADLVVDNSRDPAALQGRVEELVLSLNDRAAAMAGEED